jgi:BON domain
MKSSRRNAPCASFACGPITNDRIGIARASLRRAAALLALSALAHTLPAGAADAPLRRNPFDDPFIRATQGSDCPAPLGPAYTETQRLQESHSRIERGTSCWLAGECAEPNAYRFDAAIARAVVAALRADASLVGSSVWVTSQRRFVYLEGCVTDTAQAARAEALAKAVANVQLVTPALALPGERPPYAVAPPP